MVLKANQIYRHFKGNLYKIVTVAIHTETEEELVIYQALYGDFKVYARPLSMFMSEVDRDKYPEVTQKMRFELVEQMVEAVEVPVVTGNVPEETAEVPVVTGNVSKDTLKLLPEEHMATVTEIPQEIGTEKENLAISQKEECEEITLDPLLEEYLDTDSCRERLNILHGLQHRITEHMLNTMAIVIDFELPEGDIQTKYNALQDCLLTKEKYECNRMF